MHNKSSIAIGSSLSFATISAAQWLLAQAQPPREGAERVCCCIVTANRGTAHVSARSAFLYSPPVLLGQGHLNPRTRAGTKYRVPNITCIDFGYRPALYEMAWYKCTTARIDFPT